MPRAEDHDVFYNVTAPAWKWDDGLIAALRGMAEGGCWDSERNRALMLTAADRLAEKTEALRVRDENETTK